MLFAKYSSPKLQMENSDGTFTELKSVSGLYYQRQQESWEERIGYIGDFTSGGITTVYEEDDNGKAKALITVTYPNVATLSDGSSADLVIKYTKVKIQTDLADDARKTYTYTDAAGVEHTINVPLGIIDANQLYVDPGFSFGQDPNDKTNWAFETAKFGVEIEYEVSVEKDGNTVDGTILWTANDLDIDDRYTGKEYNTDGSKVPYAESMEILEGAKSYAVTPYYDHSSPTNPIGFQIDNAYYNNADSTANGVRFFAAREDGSTYDSGFSALISSGGTKMRWTGSKENHTHMGTVLFDTTVINQIRMSHGTGGGIYLENYDGDNKCSVEKIEGIAAHGLYAEATVTAVPEDGYRVKAIYVDDTGEAATGYDATQAGKTKYEIKYTYDKDSGTYEVDGIVDPNDGDKVVKIGTDGKYTMSNGLVFEVNDDGTVDVTMKGISNFKHVHADFATDYYFYKVWKGDSTQALDMSAVPLAIVPTDVTIDMPSGNKDTDGNDIYDTSTYFMVDGDTYTTLGGDVYYLNEFNDLVSDAVDEDGNTITDSEGNKVVNRTRYRLIGNDFMYTVPTEKVDDEGNVVTDDEGNTVYELTWVKAATVNTAVEIDEQQEKKFVIDDDSKYDGYVTVLAKGDEDSPYPDNIVWKIRYPEDGVGTLGWPAIPSEKDSTHEKNHVNRNYWFVTEKAPGWAVESYNNDTAKAPGVIKAPTGYTDTYYGEYVDDEWKGSEWAAATVKDHEDALKTIREDNKGTAAYMSIFDDGGGVITNVPSLVVQGTKEWEDFSNDFETRQDIWLHIDSLEETENADGSTTTTTKKDVLPPQMLDRTLTDEKHTVTWGNLLPYTADGRSTATVNVLSLNAKTTTAVPLYDKGTLVVGSYNDIPTRIDNVVVKKRTQNGDGSYTLIDKRNNTWTVWVNELFEKDGVKYVIRETLDKEGNQPVEKDNAASGLIGYTTEADEVIAETQTDDQGKVERYTLKDANGNAYKDSNDNDITVALKSGTIENELELTDFAVVKKWIDGKTHDAATDASTLKAAYTLYENGNTAKDKTNLKLQPAAAVAYTAEVKDETTNEVTTPESGTLETENGTSGDYTTTKFTWHNIPKYVGDKNDAGEHVVREAVYSIREKQIDGYDEPIYSENVETQTTQEDDGEGNTTDVTTNVGAKDQGLITNIQLIDVKVTKVWDDEKDRDAVRKPVDVTRTEDSEKATAVDGDNKPATQTITKDEDWSFTWKKLPYATEDGIRIIYSAVEESLDNYTTVVKPATDENNADKYDAYGYDKENGIYELVITNTHEPGKIGFTLNKSWNDNNDQDGKRPADTEKLTFTIKQDGKGLSSLEFKKSDNSADMTGVVKDKDGTALTYENGKFSVEVGKLPATVENLPAFTSGQSGVAHEYSITEADVDSYTASYAGKVKANDQDHTGTLTVTNTHVPEQIYLRVVKDWDDEDNRDGKRAAATLQLWKTVAGSRDETKYNSAPVKSGAASITKDTADNAEVVVWGPLDAYEGGKKITYRVEEAQVSGYNAPTYKTTFTKTDDSAYNDTAKNGSVVAADVKQTTDATQDPAVNNTMATVTVTNTHTPLKANILVRKTWDDADNQDGKRTGIMPTVKLEKQKEGETTWNAVAGAGAKSVPDTNGTNPVVDSGKDFTWENLPAYEDGKLLTYRVTEEGKLAGYSNPTYTSQTFTLVADAAGTTAQDQTTTVTNKYVPEKASVKVVKTWDDGNNQDGMRVGNIAFTLKGSDGSSNTQSVTIDTTAADNANAGEYIWTDLPVYKDGKKITYTLTEDTVLTGYTTDYAGTDTAKKNEAFELTNSGTYEVTVTNTHAPMTGTVKVTKVWDDAGAGSQAKHDELTFTLKAGAETVGTKTVPANATGAALSVEWANLPAYKDGSAITYTVEEAGADARYTTTINPAAGVTITSAGETKEVTVTNSLAEPPAATPLVTKDGQFESSGNLNTQSVDANTAFTAKGTGPDGTPNKIVKIELDVPDGVEGATKNPDGSVTVPGEGTYRLDENGTVTFTPEEGFTGKSSGVKLTGTDANGETVETTYTPIVVPNKQTATLTREVEYRYVDSDGNEVTQMVTETYEFERIGSYNPAKDDDPTGYNSDPSDPDDQTTIDFPAWTPTTAKAPVSPDKSADGWVVRNDADDLAGLTPDNATQLGFTADADGNLVRHDTVYYDPVPPVGTPKETFGLIGQPQKTDANKLFDVTTTTTKTGEPNKIETIQLVDPDTGKATDGPVTAYDTTGKPCGTFQIDPETGIVTFTPNPDYEGVPDVRPVTLIATDSNGLTATATYQPHTVTADDTFTNTRTINYIYDDGTPVLDDEGNPLTVTQSVTFTREPERDEEGNVRLDENGNIVWKDWTPETGSIEDVESPDLPDNWYTDQKTVDGASGITPANAKDKMPDVTVVYHKPPTAGEKVTYGGRGETQTGTPPFTKGSKDFTGFTLIDPETGEPTDKITIEGEGTYTVDPKTGEVTFVPEPDFVGKGTGVTVRGTDENGNTADGKYTPNVVDNQQTQDKVQNITYVYEDGTPVLDDEGNPRTAQRKSTFTRTGKVDPETGTVTWDAWTPANLDEVKSPDITDYTPDKETVPATSATPETWPADEQIVYTPESKKIPWATWVDPATGRTIKAPTDFNPNGTEPGAPENPTREGYNFDGWDRSVDEEGNVTYTAKWVPQHYTIKYDANGGTGTMESQNFTGADNEAVSKTNEFTREGYTFVGFKALLPDGTYLKGENGEDLVFATAEDFMAYFYEFGDGSEITLIAQWEPVETPAPAKTYWVTYVDPATGRTIMEKTTVPVGDPEPAAPANPTREGYTFDGWDRSVDADGNITYTAKWKPVEKAAPTPTPVTTRTTTTSTPTVRQVATTPAATTPRTADSNPLAAWAALAVAAAATMAFARSRSTAPQASRGKHSR